MPTPQSCTLNPHKKSAFTACQLEIFLIAVEKSDYPFPAQKRGCTFQYEKRGQRLDSGGHWLQSILVGADGVLSRRVRQAGVSVGPLPPNSRPVASAPRKAARLGFIRQLAESSTVN